MDLIKKKTKNLVANKGEGQEQVNWSPVSSRAHCSLFLSWQMEGSKKKKKKNHTKKWYWNFTVKQEVSSSEKLLSCQENTEASIHRYNVVSNVTAFEKAHNTLWPYYLQRIPEEY